MGKVSELIEDIKKREKMTTSEVLTKYKELVILLDEEEKRENSLNEQKDKRVLLKD
jgi:hypothetical protein|tara:strand:+ start:1578 stop:1745 length:168 start_codon:yes stop_codon:yes gene_type:complete